MAQDTTLFLAFMATALAAVFLVLWNRRRRTLVRPAVRDNWILIDGSNVMHWQDGTVDLAPVSAVIRRLQDLGYVPGVVFDANAGWKLAGRYLHDRDLARRLGVDADQVLVVPKGSPADPFLLQTAREFDVPIVTNDRFRDWAETHPEVLKPGYLIKGGMRDGEVWLKGLTARNRAP